MPATRRETWDQGRLAAYHAFGEPAWQLTLGKLEPTDQLASSLRGRSEGRFRSTVLLGKTVECGATKRMRRRTP